MKANPSHGSFEDLMGGVTSDLGSVCEALRKLIHEIHTDAVEIVWTRQRIASYGVGPKKMTQHYAYIAPQTKYVNLGFYHGSGLADPKGLLEGTGQHLRHVKIRSLAAASGSAVRSLLADSIAERQDVQD